MTTHHMFTAAEARALLGETCCAPWSCEPPREVISLAVSRVLREGSYLVAEVVAEHASLVAAAPDLAASVVALHAEVERLRAILPPERERGQGIVGDGSWAVFAERVVAERDALDEELTWMIDALIGPQDDLGTDEALRLAREEIGRLKALAPRPAQASGEAKP